MRYQPNFCNNCGEKIERPEFSIRDSTRFCDVCKHDFIPVRAAPFLFCSLMAVVAVFGLGSYLRSGEKPVSVSPKQFTSAPANANRAASSNPLQSNFNAPTATVQSQSPAANKPSDSPAKQAAKQTDSLAPTTNDAVYFCGAMTKKGTPCSRRVKGGGRCWQHKGQAALLPAEKLLVSQ